MLVVPAGSYAAKVEAVVNLFATPVATMPADNDTTSRSTRWLLPTEESACGVVTCGELANAVRTGIASEKVLAAEVLPTVKFNPNPNPLVVALNDIVESLEEVVDWY